MHFDGELSFDQFEAWFSTECDVVDESEDESSSSYDSGDEVHSESSRHFRLPNENTARKPAPKKPQKLPVAQLGEVEEAVLTGLDERTHRLAPVPVAADAETLPPSVAPLETPTVAQLGEVEEAVLTGLDERTHRLAPVPVAADAETLPPSVAPLETPTVANSATSEEESVIVQSIRSLPNFFESDSTSTEEESDMSATVASNERRTSAPPPVPCKTLKRISASGEWHFLSSIPPTRACSFISHDIFVVVSDLKQQHSELMR